MKSKKIKQKLLRKIKQNSCTQSKIKPLFKKSIGLEISKETRDKLGRHCVSIWIGKSIDAISTEKPELGLQPIDNFGPNTEKNRTATLTFIKVGGKCYAITAYHVVSTLDRQNKIYSEENNIPLDNFRYYKFYMITNHYVDLSKLKFKQPAYAHTDSEIDIAIAEIEEKIIKEIGKSPVMIENHSIKSPTSDYAIAIGFPENKKKSIYLDNGSKRISMPHCEIIAEVIGDGEIVTMHSNIKEKVSKDISGMSGGPIFRAKRKKYNLIGIIMESPRSDSFIGENDIFLRGVGVNLNKIKQWVDELFKK